MAEIRLFLINFWIFYPLRNAFPYSMPPTITSGAATEYESTSASGGTRDFFRGALRGQNAFGGGGGHNPKICQK